MSEPFRTVLGTNKGTQRSRVWIEGQRLIDAGFKVGKKYRRWLIRPGALQLIRDDDGSFKVSGKGEKPIIDITGKLIINNFPGTHVLVEFEPGSITIRKEGN